MDEAYQDQVTPSTDAPELTDRGVTQCQEKISPKRPGGRSKASAGKCKERPIAKQPYRGVIISVKVSVYAADESLVTALVKLSLESTIIATLDLSQGFPTNEDVEAYGFEMGQWWIDERRERRRSSAMDAVEIICLMSDHGDRRVSRLNLDSLFLVTALHASPEYHFS